MHLKSPKNLFLGFVIPNFNLVYIEWTLEAITLEIIGVRGLDTTIMGKHRL